MARVEQLLLLLLGTSMASSFVPVRPPGESRSQAGWQRELLLTFSRFQTETSSLSGRGLIIRSHRFAEETAQPREAHSSR
jgi:hypothetical protein